MSDAPPPTDIQFDRAEFKGGHPPIACASCGAAIRSTYYQVGAAITCEQCRWRLDTEATGGSAIGRFLKATLLGFLASGLGAAVYYAVRAVTGYEIGIIAIVVGLLVGGAVRMGSSHRGGLPYQLLAMFLTYGSIVSTYIPDIWKGLSERAESEQAAPAPDAGTASPAAASTPVTPKPPHAFNPLLLVLALLALVALAFAAPFLMGFENIIGIVIIAIGLYEAWKINRKPDRTVTGPFRIEDASTAAPSPGIG